MSTPDALRGRLSAVNVIFAKGGPELGEFEAGLITQAFGPSFSVVSGGLLCLACTAWIAWKTPGLRGYVREGATVVARGAASANARSSVSHARGATAA